MSLTGKEIYRTYDDYGPVIVMDDGNKRYMAFSENDEQSCLLKSDPGLLQHDYCRAMLLVLLFKQPKTLLMFGMGGGTLATCLHQHVPGLKLTVVELRDAVIKAAYRFFQFPRSKRMTVITMDASDYLDDDSQPQTDILFSDMYGAEGLDLQQTQPWFLQRCHESLKPDGWLVLNWWNQHRGEKEMLGALCELFVDVRVCTTQEGNWVVFAGKKQSSTSAAQLKVEGKKWSKKLGYSLTANLGRLNHYNGPR